MMLRLEDPITFRNSPLGVGFHEPKFKKQAIWHRYPVAFHRIFVTSCLLVFFRCLLTKVIVSEVLTYLPF